MTLRLTREELEAVVSPLGYEIFEQSSETEDVVNLSISHPDHEGTAIEISLLAQSGKIEHLERVINGGVEQELFDNSPFFTPEFHDLPESQQNHLHCILLGEFLEIEFEDVDEFLAVIGENIKVRPTL